MSRIWSDNNWFREVDLSDKLEKELSGIFKSHVAEFFPDMMVYEFEHVMSAAGYTTRADLCLISKNLDRWFIVEVEKSSHDFYGHVLPQIQRFKDALFDADLIERFITKSINKNINETRRLLYEKPPGLIVVVDGNFEDENTWRAGLKYVNTMMLSLRLFRSESSNRFLFHMLGELPSHQTSLIASCRLMESSGYNMTELIINSTSALPTTIEKIDIIYNGIESNWTIHRSDKKTVLLHFTLPKKLRGLRFELHSMEGKYILKEY